jgi:hypothetical protein
MKTSATLLVAVAAFAMAVEASPERAEAQYYQAGRMTWTGPNSYVYDATSYYRRPPVYYYPGYGSYYGYSRALPPYGFGSPYYSGYNDPYYGSYGPGVREFLRFGGADFYGW